MANVFGVITMARRERIHYVIYNVTPPTITLTELKNVISFIHVHNIMYIERRE